MKHDARGPTAPSPSSRSAEPPAPGRATLADTPDGAAMSPGASAPGRRSLVEVFAARPGGPGDWPDLVALFGIQRPMQPPRGAVAGAARRADSRGPIQRQEAAGDADAAQGACLDPEAIIAELQRIAAAAARTLDVDQLRDLSAAVEALRPLIEDCVAVHIRAPQLAALRHTQDVLVRRFQALAVQHADQTLQAWDAATPDERREQRAQYQSESGWGLDPTNPAVTVTQDWCGMFANAQFRAAGFAPAFNMAFAHADNVPQFFEYQATSRSPGTIKPSGQDPAVPLRDYHELRGSLRSWREGADIGDDLRPGDVVTINLDGDAGADHICIVASYTPPGDGQLGRLVTIDGNAYGARKPGSAPPAFDGSAGSMTTQGDKTTHDVSTSAYERTGDASHPDFDRGSMIPKASSAFRTMTVFGRGRPSLVDFEAGHEYPGFTGDTDGPGGPIQRKERGPGAVAAADPGAAFDAATAGASGEIPYRAEMQQRFGADFSSVRAYPGRDLGSLGAHAATRGEQVAFASPSPDRETVAHELTHVVQSRNGSAGSAAVSDPGDASEHEARGVAASIAAGQPIAVGATVGSAVIHRQETTQTPTPTPDGPAQDPYDEQVSAIIEDFLESYQAIPLSVPKATSAASGDTATTTETATTTATATATETATATATPTPTPTPTPRISVNVSIPYWNNDYARYKQSDADKQGAAYTFPQPSAEYSEANGSEATNTVRNQGFADYDQAMGTRDTISTPVAVAKGSAEEIRQLVQNAVDHGLIHAEPAASNDDAGWQAVWRTAIEHWMAVTGIGLDCNGLVYQALLEIQQRTGASTTRQGPSGANSVFEYFGVFGDDGQINDRRSMVSVDVLGSKGDEVEEIDLRPGDVMMIPGHVRIVMRIDTRDAAEPLIEFTTAESTVSPRFATGSGANGPRLHHWQWRNGVLSEQYEDSDVWEVVTEEPVYRRHLVPPSA